MRDLPPLRISSGTLEALKWLAFAGMVIDHIDSAYFDRTLPAWADAIGRPVFPLFAAVFAYNLARPGLDVVRVGRRLLWPALVAIPAHSWLFSEGGLLPLNILVLFAVCAACVWLADRKGIEWAVMLAIVGGVFVEYHHFGIALVLAGVAYMRRPDALRLSLYLATFAGLCVYNGNGWAITALVLLALATRVDVPLPRSGPVLRWFYPVHLYVLAAIALVFPGVVV